MGGRNQQEPVQAAPSLDEVRRDVQVEPRPDRQAVGGRERRLERRRFRSMPAPTDSASANRVSGLTPSLKRVSASYPRTASRAHVDDRLEHGPEGRGGDVAWVRLAHVRGTARPFADLSADQDAGEVGELDQ